MKLIAVISLGAFAVTVSPSRAASLNYANSSGTTFTFSQMSEYSYLNTFIGSIPGNIPQVFTDPRGDYLNWVPSTVLDAAANSSAPSAYATSRFSTVISGNTAPGSTMPANIPIPGLEIVFDLSTDFFGPSSAATFDFSASLYLQVFGVNGNESSVSRNFKKTFLDVPALTGSWSSQGTFQFTHTIHDLEEIFRDVGFTPSTMNITKLGLSLTPEINVTATSGSAQFQMNQMTIAIIPEPSTASLLLLGLVPLLRARRNWKSC
jgi:hypothetical protein